MEIRKTTLLTEKLYGETVAQAQMESAIPLPQGKTAERVLLEEAEAAINEVVCRDGAVSVTGTMTVKPTVEGADQKPFAFEAAATFSHTIRMDGVTPEMSARVSAEIPACTLRREDGGLRLQATVQLRTAVFVTGQIPCITALEDANGLEQRTAALTLKRRALLGAHSARVNETIQSPKNVSVLRAGAVPLITTLRKGTEGQLVQGELKLAVLYAEPDGGVRRELYTVPFSDVIACEPGEDPYATATLRTLTVTIDEEGSATVDAALSIGIYGVKSETERVLIDAYDASGSFSCENRSAETLCYEGARFETVQLDETLAVPGHLKDAYLPLYAAMRPAITRITVQEGQGRIEGILAVTALYRSDEGTLLSFTQELPLSFDTEAKGTLLFARIRAYDAALSGGGRTIGLRCSVTVEAEWYCTRPFSYVPELAEGKPCETDCGMVVWFADEGETLFSIGKRFRVPTARVAASNPTLSEPIPACTPILLIRAN